MSIRDVKTRIADGQAVDGGYTGTIKLTTDYIDVGGAYDLGGGETVWAVIHCTESAASPNTTDVLRFEMKCSSATPAVGTPVIQALNPTLGISSWVPRPDFTAGKRIAFPLAPITALISTNPVTGRRYYYGVITAVLGTDLATAVAFTDGTFSWDLMIGDQTGTKFYPVPYTIG